jgi:thiol-disulfide isomerase/thioredoxin
MALLAMLYACGGAEVERDTITSMRTGPWRMELDLRTARDSAPLTLPFLFTIAADSGVLAMAIHNGEEIIHVDDIRVAGDSIRIRLPLFDTEFIGTLSGDSLMSGQWHNHTKGPDHAIPFVARAGAQHRFGGTPASPAALEGTWACHFAPGSKDAYSAVGLFWSDGVRVMGSFGTESGDYRFLEGARIGDTLLLSGFDGSHAFLFSAQLRNDSLLGVFSSGKHGRERWVGVRDPNFHLRDPDSLTTLKAGHDRVHIRLPDLNGDTISLEDRRFVGRVRMVQIMGSWCPNCMDESRLLADVYRRHHGSGLDIVAVAFERGPDPGQAVERLQRYKERLAIPYDILYGGTTSKEVVANRLPFLEHLMSYPTCIFIDRQGRVRRIHTGFYGPGTGRYYEAYAQELEAFLRQLLAEPAPKADS